MKKKQEPENKQIPEKTLTIIMNETDVQRFLNELIMHIRVNGYANANDFMEVNPHYKPVIKAMIEAVEVSKSNIKVGKKYIYDGDVKTMKGNICEIVDLLEYKIRKDPDSLIKVRFDSGLCIFAVYARHLKEVKK